MLSAEELERYARHIVLHEIGGPGQQALKRARVLVIGAGGLGAPALLYLAAAGVGTLGVIDDDAVALSNLQRQVIHGTPEIGEPKVESAAAAIRRLNPHVTVETHAARLVAANALALMAGYDVVADGSDNFATRYLVADACFFAKKPLVTAAVRHGSDLCGGRHPRRAYRRARLAHGARSDPGNRRLRRGARRAAAHVRRPHHALRDAAIRLGSVQPAFGRASHDQGFIASRLIIL